MVTYIFVVIDGDFEKLHFLVCNDIEDVNVSGSESKVSAGVIDIQVELFPKTKQALSNEVITAQIQLERGRHAEQERLFLVYAKQWWKEYLTIREIHKERLVKIFAQVYCKHTFKI